MAGRTFFFLNEVWLSLTFHTILFFIIKIVSDLQGIAFFSDLFCFPCRFLFTPSISCDISIHANFLTFSITIFSCECNLQLPFEKDIGLPYVLSHVCMNVLHILGNWRAIQIILRPAHIGWPAEIATWAFLTRRHPCGHLHLWCLMLTGTSPYLHCALTTGAQESWLLITREKVKFSKWFKSYRWLYYRQLVISNV